MYRFKDAPDFSAGASELGSKTFAASSLNDSITIIRRGDTSKVVNVLRIPLNNSLGEKLSSFDTLQGPNGGYYSDSIFKQLFKGLVITADPTGNVLNYFRIDVANTSLTVYFQTQRGGKIDTTSVNFAHVPVAPALFPLEPIIKNPANFRNGKSNRIERTEAAPFTAAVSGSGSPDGSLYIQSPPKGSVAILRVPGLDTLSNNIVHLAELIITRVPDANSNIFTPPAQLILEKLKTPTSDTGYIFESDLLNGGSVAFNLFGGQIRKDDTYRFKLTRHVQGIVTRDEPNYPMRLSLPYNANLYIISNNAQLGPAQVLSGIARGRVIVAGGNYTPDPAQRMRLRVVYSKL
jgi:hypothetical protein